jgi:hypothetical protein
MLLSILEYIAVFGPWIPNCVLGFTISSIGVMGFVLFSLLAGREGKNIFMDNFFLSAVNESSRFV